MLVVYNLVIQCYHMVVKAVAPMHPKARLWVQGRKDLLEKLEREFSGNSKKVAWFHCASLGEFEQARPVLEAFKSKWNNYAILLTFYSPSGYEIRKNYPHADYVSYLPLDTHNNASRFLQIIKPAIAFFAKYEFWYHYLQQLQIKRIPVVLFSATFRPNQLFFKSYGGFFRKILSSFTYIFVQDLDSHQLLATIDVHQASVAGDTRFDRVLQIASQPIEIPLINLFKVNQKMLVAGSTWQKDLDVIMPVILKANIKTIIAPHEISNKSIHQLLLKTQGRSVKYSEANPSNIHKFQILIIDNIGMLAQLYQYANVAYIGGGFGKGIHNVLEAAVWGIPVIFGPAFQKFKEASDLIYLKSAQSINSQNEFLKGLHQFTNLTTTKVAATNKSYFQDNQGATGQILHYCNALMNHVK